MNQTVHPPEDILTRYLLGKASDLESGEIENHLSECDSCRSSLDQLNNHSDTLVNLMRDQETVGEYSAESEYQAAIVEILERAPSDQPGSGLDHTLDFSLPDSPPMSRKSQDLSGIELGEYQINGCIGQGGMGAVYKAVHRRLNREVAIKTLIQPTGSNHELSARLEREMLAVGRLDHPNLVRATDAQELDGTLFLVMEYLDGEDLASIVSSNHPLPVDVVCEIGIQAATGLQYAHAHDLVHRDVKPQNFMLTRDGVVKLLDLGLARIHQEDQSQQQLTHDNQVLGTIDYLPPEQMSDAVSVDARADLYSLGCTLFYLLTRQAPFGQMKTIPKKMMAHLKSTPSRVDTLRADCPPELSDLISKLLAKNPDDRIQTAADVASELSKLTSGNALKQITPSLFAEIANKHAGAEQETRRDEPTLVGTFTGVQDTNPAAPTVEKRSESNGTRLLWPLVVGACLLGVVIAGVAFTFKTKYGELVIEADGNVAAEFENETVKIRDKDTGRSYELTVGKNHVATGNYEILFLDKESGLRFSSREFTIHSSKETKIDVRLESAEPSPKATTKIASHKSTDKGTSKPATPVNQDTNHQIANWIIGAGGNLDVTVDGNRMRCGASTDLPKEFEIVGIRLGALPEDTNAFKQFRELSQLTLFAADCSLSTADIVNVAAAPNLEALLVTGAGVTDEAMAAVAKLQSLKQLTLAVAKLTNSGIESVANLPNLETIIFRQVELSVEMVSAMKAMRNLKSLSIREADVPKEIVAHIVQMKNLLSVGIMSLSFDDERATLLAEMTQLQMLSLNGSPVTDEFVAKLTGMEKLWRLGLRHSKVTEACFPDLKKLPSLTDLDLTQVKIEEAKVAEFSRQMPKCGIAYELTGPVKNYFQGKIR